MDAPTTEASLPPGTWSTTGSMTVARTFEGDREFTATLLTDGRVLVAGGFQCSGVCSPVPTVASAELYNPITGSWSPTGSMTVAREFHTATRLLDGRVLVAGGDSSGTSAELYDPTTGTWSATRVRARGRVRFPSDTAAGWASAGRRRRRERHQRRTLRSHNGYVVADWEHSFAPSLNRIFVRFTVAGGVPLGSTSVAVKTQ